MRVLVWGSDRFTRTERLDWLKRNALYEIAHATGSSVFTVDAIIHCCGQVADHAAEDWAKVVECPEVTAYEISTYEGQFMRRNREMIVEGKPDIIIMFSGGWSSQDLRMSAEAAGINVIVVSDRGGSILIKHGGKGSV